jgi:uncharacterized membrane protein YtjA (UPF0391 family)
MKMIPRFYHAVLDYVVGLILLLSPNLLGFSDVGGATAWVPRILGLIILLQAMMTDYELGVIKAVPIRVHLMTDYFVGLFVIGAPWFFGFSKLRVPMMTHLIVGLLVLASTAMTQPVGRPRKLMA